MTSAVVAAAVADAAGARSVLPRSSASRTRPPISTTPIVIAATRTPVRSRGGDEAPRSDATGCAVVPPPVNPVGGAAAASGGALQGTEAGLAGGLLRVPASPGGSSVARAPLSGGAPKAARVACSIASRIAAALGQRDAFSNASARSMTSATTGGTSGTTLRRGRACVVAARIISCAALSPSCTGCPLRSVNSVAPTAQTSVCPSISLALRVAPARGP